MIKYVEWIEPLYTRNGDIIGNTFVRALPEDIINLNRYNEPRWKNYSDEDVLNSWMVVNWAYFKEHEE